MREWLVDKLGEFVDVDAFLASERFVDQHGTPFTPDSIYAPHTFIWFYRDLRDEPAVPGKIRIVYRDERLIVVDKPPFLSTIPRGRHVIQSVTTRMRAALSLPELSPAHRLDRVTSGLLLLTTQRRWRGAYQSLFQNGQVTRTYEALAPTLCDREFPCHVENHLHKVSGRQRVDVVDGAPPNARTCVEVAEHLGEVTRYRLHPETGKTHQLRQHLCSIGAPILGDPLYPQVQNISVDDFSTPLQLLANSLSFRDPVDGTERSYEAVRTLPLTPETDLA
jgi:tRNA pseudouridine32 synthase/23S rRNA pseudouridine746 synthase